MKLLFSHNETPSIIITMEVDDLPIELEGEASCARCLRGGLEHFRGRKPAGRGADGPWDYAGIGM